MDHVMLWENKDARTIPSKYLKVRWRKTAKVGVDFVIQFGGETDPDSEVSRYHELMSMFSVLALESAPLVETTNMAKQFASDGRDRVRAVILEHHGETITSEPSTHTGPQATPPGDGRRIPKGLKEKTNVNKSTKRLKSTQQMEREKSAHKRQARVRRQTAMESEGNA
ncbi:hypothetical protein LINPERHAP1_LOCUS36291 [Linum perenne]